MSCSHLVKYAKNLCKKCYEKQWYLLNKDKEKKRCSDYYKSNKTIRLKKGSKWRKENKDKLRNYYKQRLINDPEYRLRNLLRARLRAAIKNHQKVGSAVKDLGCTVNELKIYLESKFTINSHTNEVMSWDNYGDRWQIDHIKELKSFDLSNRDQFLKACNYTNLQPLWNEDHLIKTAKFNAIKSSV